MEPINELGEATGSLFQTILFWAIALFVLLEIALLFAVFRFRRLRTGSGRTGSKKHRGLEFAWTLAPALILLAIGVPSVYSLFRDGGPRPEESLRIEITAHSWGWEFRYPNAGVTATDQLHLPVGLPLHLILTAEESLHSFRIPELGGKWDLIPGRTNHVWVEPEEVSQIVLPCPRSCVGAHAPLHIVIESRADFTSWLAARAAQGTGSRSARGGHCGSRSSASPAAPAMILDSTCIALLIL